MNEAVSVNKKGKGGKILGRALAFTLTGIMLVSSDSVSVLFKKPFAEQIIKTVNHNHEYIMRVARRDKLLRELIKNKSVLASYLADILKTLPHTDPPAGKGEMTKIITNPTKDDLEKLELIDLIKIYYLLNALKNDEFRLVIGSELDKDTADKTGEHGGALCLGEIGDVTLRMVPNKLVVSDTANYSNGQYNPDAYYHPEIRSSEIGPTVLTALHLHARRVNHSGCARLSPDDFKGDYGELVFTRIGKNKFNVDMGFVRVKPNSPIIIDGVTTEHINIDLGVYSY
ncbi:MAG: hypothetical protein AB1468_03495 [Candidatus Micrarchaeota archaeon]